MKAESQQLLSKHAEAARKPRLIADATVSMEDIRKPLLMYLAFTDSKDLWGLISPTPTAPSQFSWKTRPVGEWLANVSGLFYDLAGVCPNTKIASTKLQLALKSLMQNGHMINNTKKSDREFVDMIDVTLRILMSHFRTLKTDNDQYLRTSKKLSAKDLCNYISNSVFVMMCNRKQHVPCVFHEVETSMCH